LRAAKEFRFAGQMQSAAGLIMDSMAEGFERNSRLEFANSLSIAEFSRSKRANLQGPDKARMIRCLPTKNDKL